MAVRTIYINFNQPFWEKVAEYLAKECDWMPMLWVGRPEMASHIREKFPQVRYHPILGAVKGVQPPDFVDIEPAILRSALFTRIFRRSSGYAKDDGSAQRAGVF